MKTKSKAAQETEEEKIYIVTWPNVLPSGKKGGLKMAMKNFKEGFLLARNLWGDQLEITLRIEGESWKETPCKDRVRAGKPKI